MSRKLLPPSHEPSAVSEALRLTHASNEPQVGKRQEITTAIYALTRECGWEIGGFWNTYPMSFYWAEERQGERKFALLIHKSSPFVALSSAFPDCFNLIFFDDPAFAEAAQRIVAPFGILPASELARPLSDADRVFVTQLSAQHERDVRYWKPDIHLPSPPLLY
jgi:hypothetical protein